MNYSGVVTQVIVLYIIIFIGAFANKIKILEDEAIGSISKIIINIGIPAIIISSLSNSDKMTAQSVSLTLLLSICCYMFMFLVGFIVAFLLKVKKENKPFYWFISMFGNVGFIGYPMVIAILGGGAILTASVFNVSYNLLFLSLGLYLIQMYRGLKGAEKFNYKIIVNPAIITSVISVTLFLLKIELPQVINKTALMIGGLTSPLATLVVGASLNKINIKKAIKNYRVLIMGLVKMTLVPLAVAYILRWIGISGMPAMVAVVLVGMPVGTGTVILANLYNKDHIEKAAEATVMSTLMLILTIPILIYAVGIVS